MPSSKKRVDGYIIQTLSGAGGHGTLWKGRNASTGAEVSVRILDRNHPVRTETYSRLHQEIAILRKIVHPNVVRLQDTKKTASHIYLILDHCPGGSLSDLLSKRGRLPEETARLFVAQLAAGVNALHQVNALHGDLRPSNVLLAGSTTHPLLKISNIGCRGVPSPYAAPEVLQHQPHDTSADVWPLGAMLCEFVVGRKPFVGVSETRLLESIEQSQWRARISGALVSISNDARDFLESVMQQNPVLRPTAESLCRHAYLAAPPQDGAQIVQMRIGTAIRKQKPDVVVDMVTVLPSVVLRNRLREHFPQIGFSKVAADLERSKSAWTGPATNGVQLAGHNVLRRLGVKLGWIAESDQLALVQRSPRVCTVVGRGLLHTAQGREQTLVNFVMGQLRSSHMFRIRTSRMCPSIMTASVSWSSAQSLIRLV